MRRLASETAEALYEHYVISRTPSEEHVALCLLVMLPVASAAMFAATAAYLLAN
jgi:hypothetical protein